MTQTTLLLLCFLIGAATGLRSMTGIALLSIAAQVHWPHLNWLHLSGTGLAFLSMPVSMFIFAALAAGELIADKLPFIPARIQVGPLAVRAAFGGLCASGLAVAAGVAWFVPAAIGAVAALVGAYSGYWLRRILTSGRVKDFPVALLEDLCAILLALFAVSRF